jgi:hypothetical protein
MFGEKQGSAGSTSGLTITHLPAVEAVTHAVLGVFSIELKSVNGVNGNVKLTCTGNECVDFQ